MKNLIGKIKSYCLPKINRGTLVITVIAILLILFYEPLENLINFLLVEPLFCYPKSQYGYDIIFGLISIGLILFFLKKKKIKYRFTFNQNVIALITIIFYLAYRCFSEVWEFTPFAFFNSLKYLDIILIPPFMVLTNPLFIKKEPELNESETGFYRDNPLGKSCPDILQRENIAKHIAVKLANSNSIDNSFSIGIYGEWGSGKTSFVNLIKRHLDLKNCIEINFNPWINDGAQSICIDFFNTLKDKLSYYDSGISKLINNYSQLLLDLAKGQSDNISSSIQQFFSIERKSVSEEYLEVKKSIIRINKKIFVFIDDIDRLNDDEIFEVIRLIRNTANFSNIVFVVTYDRNYVVKALGKINDYKPEFFLEKIFNVEFQLPFYEKQVILDKLTVLINDKLSEADQRVLNNEINSIKHPKINKSFVYNSLHTLRDVTRFANNFLIIYNFLKEDVNLIDLLNIEMLKLKFPGVYRIFFNVPSTFLSLEKSIKSEEQLYTLRKVNPEINNESQNFVIYNYLNINSIEIGISLMQIPDVMQLLQSLFPEESKMLTSKRHLLDISYPSNFERYSYNRLLNSNLSEAEFSKFRKMDIKKFCEQIGKWIDLGLSKELCARFEKIDAYDDANDFKNIIEAIFYFARKLVILELKNDQIGYNINDLIIKIGVYDDNIILKFFKNNDEYKDFLLEILNDAKTPYLFDMEFLYRIRLINKVGFVLSNETLMEFQLKYFRDYLSKTDRFDNNLINLYSYCDLINEDKYNLTKNEPEKFRNPVANEMLIKFLNEKDLDGFLISIISKEVYFIIDSRPTPKTYSLNSIVLNVFNDYVHFENFINGIDDTKYKYLNEFKLFYAKLKRVSYKRTSFKFSVIPIEQK